MGLKSWFRFLGLRLRVHGPAVRGLLGVFFWDWSSLYKHKRISGNINGDTAM